MPKKILIVGQNSYIGNSFEHWMLKNKKNKFEIDKISVRDNSWENITFYNYDIILYVAAIVHSKNIQESIYKKINTDLPIKVAEKAKNENVKQFIFLSTMNVFGEQNGVISRTTKLTPTTHYGISKLRAEEALTRMNSFTFKVLVLRPPMVYGENCPGNYSKLSFILNRTFIFPITNNSRSAIYIDNLSYYIYRTISDVKSGILHPQNNEYLNIKDIVDSIKKLKNKKIITFKLPKNLMSKFSITNKIYGDLKYDKNIDEYQVKVPLEVKRTFKMTEKNK